MPSDKRFHLIVHGHVQGVNFRYSTQQKAMELGLKGWVRNRKEGNVEIIAEGPAEVLDDFINWCKVGPRMATVTEVEMEEVAKTSNLTEFSIQY